MAGAAGSLLVVNQRVYRRQVQLAGIATTMREATAILTSELRGLDASAASGSDVLHATSSSLTYRAIRSLYVACAKPDLVRSALRLYARFSGPRALDPAVDSLLLFAEGDPTTADDDRWVHGDLRAITRGPACADGRPGITIRLGGVARSDLGAVGVGAPVRGAALWQVKGYRGGGGLWWVGMRRYRKASRRWPSIQPVLGPIAPGGLRFRYYDAAGVPTEATDRMASVGVTVTPAAGDEAPHRALVEQEGLVLRVALRNSLSSS